MVYYQRRSNALNWLVFFAIGGLVFGGLVLLLLYGKQYSAKQQSAAAEAESQHKQKQMDPITLVREELKKQYKNNGQALDIVERTPGKETESGTLKKKVTIVRIRHRPTGGSDEDIKDEVFLVDGTKIFLAKWPDGWDDMKKKYELTDEP
jgi:hypothetical protein